MGISEKVGEFAGYPVVDYQPEVGIVLPTMPRREFRTAAARGDFLAVALAGDRLTVERGPVGSAGEAEVQTFPTPADAQAAYRALVAEQVKAGYTPYVERTFHRADGGAATFWTVLTSGGLMVVRTGPVGGDGDEEDEEFGSATEARAAAERLIAEKVAQGYAEQTAGLGSLREGILAALAADPDDAVSRMALADHLAEQGVHAPAVAYRLDGDYDDKEGAALDAFLADPAISLVEAVVLGYCFGSDGGDARAVVAALVKARDRLPNLRALFLGDLVYTDQEISWINLCDVTGLLEAFPRLEHFRSRGGGSLELRPIEHAHLKSLTFEASNLPRAVVRAVGESRLPALEHLEIWLGTSNYGADTTVEDLQGIFDGKGLPALRYLGLRNSEIADDVAAAVGAAAIFPRLRVLDLSLGTLSDAGAEALLAVPGLADLEKLDINHHYVSPAVVERLTALGITVDAGDAQEADDDGDERYRYVAHSE